MNNLTQEEIFKVFNQRKYIQIGTNVALFIIGAIAIFYRNKPCVCNLILLFPFIFIIFYLIYRYWRCPQCSKYLGRVSNPKFCHGCGCKLIEAD